MERIGKYNFLRCRRGPTIHGCRQGLVRKIGILSREGLRVWARYAILYLKYVKCDNTEVRGDPMRRVRALAVLLAMALCLGGCSLDVESFLQPPKAQGEQQAIQQALETSIRDSGKTPVRYTLQYPAEGSYTSAFILCDETGTPLADGVGSPTMAVAFYSLPGADETHVNLLQRTAGEWMSVGDVTGFGSRVLQVQFADLDGDNRLELITGWDTYNSREHRLVLCSLDSGLTVLSKERLYASLFVGDVTATGQEDLLLLRTAADNRVTATLTRLGNGVLSDVDTAPLDGYIQQFGALSLCRLSRGVTGLFADGVKSNGTTVTELVLYEYGKLRTPFYNPATNTTDGTARQSGLASRDVNGDGLTEIPRSQRLPGYPDEKELPDYAYLTTWRSWDYATGTWSDQLYTVVNRQDGYQVTLDETQRQGITTVYTAEQRTLSLCRETTNEVWLQLRVGSALPAEGGYVWLYEPTEERAGCMARFDSALLSSDAVRYMVTRLDS